MVVAGAVLVACGDDGGTSGSCDDQLVAGDLVITEVFADFAAAPGGSGMDEGNEWFEIHNTSSRPLDLTGLTLEHSRGDGTMPNAATLDPITIAPGDYIVLGNVLGDLAPAWVDAGYADRLADLTTRAPVGSPCAAARPRSTRRSTPRSPPASRASSMAAPRPTTPSTTAS